MYIEVLGVGVQAATLCAPVCMQQLQPALAQHVGPCLAADSTAELNKTMLHSLGGFVLLLISIIH